MDGNPSDANYQKRPEETFKMKVLSNRKPVAPPSRKLEKIIEEDPVEKTE